MKFERSNCEACIHNPICGKKTDLEILRTDLMATKWFNDKEYQHMLSPFTVTVVCKYFEKSKG